jgi:Fe-S oxidoreductase
VTIRASLMITCLADVLFPEVGEAVVALLRRLGVAVEDTGGLTVRPPGGWS